MHLLERKGIINASEIEEEEAKLKASLNNKDTSSPTGSIIQPEGAGTNEDSSRSDESRILREGGDDTNSRGDTTSISKSESRLNNPINIEGGVQQQDTESPPAINSSPDLVVEAVSFKGL